MKALGIVLLTYMLVGCAFTKQPVENIAILNQGMTKQSVLSVMGTPVKSEFSGNVTAWHYCRTGSSEDEFVLVVFKGDSLQEARNYSVNAKTGGGFGDCSKFVQPVNFRAADTVNEIRIR